MTYYIVVSNNIVIQKGYSKKVADGFGIIITADEYRNISVGDTYINSEGE